MRVAGNYSSEIFFVLLIELFRYLNINAMRLKNFIYIFHSPTNYSITVNHVSSVPYFYITIIEKSLQRKIVLIKHRSIIQKWKYASMMKYKRITFCVILLVFKLPSVRYDYFANLTVKYI